MSLAEPMRGEAGPLRVLVVDDEPPARDEVAFALAQLPGVEVVGEAGDGARALELVRDVRPDVVLVDVQMPGIDGLSLARVLAVLPPPRPHVVFATAYDQYAVTAFTLNAVDYLLKPVRPERLADALERVRLRLRCNCQAPSRMGGLWAQVGQERLRKVPVNRGDRILLLDRDEVQVAFSVGRQTHVRTATGDFPTHLTLQEIEVQLGMPFARVHKSYVVNLQRVREVLPWFHGRYHLVLDDPRRTQVPVGRQYVREVRALLGLARPSS